MLAQGRAQNFFGTPDAVSLDPSKMRYWSASTSANFANIRASNVQPAANIGNIGWLKAPTTGQLPGSDEGPSHKIYCGLGAGAVANFGDNSGAGVQSMSLNLRHVKRSFFRVALNDGLWPANFNLTTTGFLILDTNGNFQEAQNANFTGLVPPVWNPVVGGNTVDNAVTWTNRGPNPAQRYWIGCCQTRAAFVGGGNGTDTPLTPFCAFRYSPTSALDTTWKAVCGNGAAQTVVDTGVAPDQTGVSHLFEIFYSRTSVTFSIDGKKVATVSATLPGVDVLMENICNVDNNGVAAANAVGLNMQTTGWEENK